MTKQEFKVIAETTKWTGIDYPAPNHTYLVRGNKAYAFIRSGKCEGPSYFTKGMLFDTRGRTFDTLKGNPFDMSKVAAE